VAGSAAARTTGFDHAAALRSALAALAEHLEQVRRQRIVLAHILHKVAHAHLGVEHEQRPGCVQGRGIGGGSDRGRKAAPQPPPIGP